MYGDLHETNLLETVLRTLGICILETNDQSKLRPDEYFRNNHTFLNNHTLRHYDNGNK